MKFVSIVALKREFRFVLSILLVIHTLRKLKKIHAFAFAFRMLVGLI